LASLAVAGLTITGTALLGSVAAPAHAWGYQPSVARSINTTRAAHRVPALRERSDLDAIAGRHARAMRANGRIYHNTRLASLVRNWRSLGENVGVGSSVAQVSNAFMRSSGHRSNLLSRSFSEMGVGAAYANGRIYIVELFRQPASATRAAPVRRYVAAPTHTATVARRVTTAAHPLLRYGSRGSAVARVQQRLRIAADGVFGAQTLAAVRAFQRAHRLTVDGVVGPNTWRALGI
jgi:peptidoglycan hydrolase-like protein with peptidoglycan-binding domain